MSIPNIGVGQVQTIGTTQIWLPHPVLTDKPIQAIPIYGPVTSPDMIGVPVIDIPGCVEAHEQNSNSVMKNKNLEKDDPDGVMVYCDAGVPSYDAMNYEPEQLIITREQEVPPVAPPPEVDPPEVPPTGDLGGEVPCPGPANLRLGDLTQAGDEKVVGHELSENGKVCVTLYEPTSPAEKFLPSPNQATTTVAIAVLATAGAAATPLLLRVIKPVIKKLTSFVQKKLGKKPYKPSRKEIETNRLRQQKGLSPLNFQKMSKRSLKKP